MSLCQSASKPFSCGGCCGIANLKHPQLNQILLERTQEFEQTVHFSVPYTIPSFRQSREKKEKQIPRFDETTYVCPFLGYLNVSPSKSRIGCLIHPEITGDPKSQNYSFYGASICQGYDCKNKERPTAKLWEDFFSSMATSSLHYTNLSADHRLVHWIEQIVQKRSSILSEFINGLLELWRNQNISGTVFPQKSDILFHPQKGFYSIQKPTEEIRFEEILIFVFAEKLLAGEGRVVGIPLTSFEFLETVDPSSEPEDCFLEHWKRNTSLS